VRVLRTAVVSFRYKIPLGLRVAKFLCPGERGGRGDGNGCQPRYGPDGGEVQPMRRAPGPCLRRWSPANRIALLRQLGSLGIGRRLKSAPAGPERFPGFWTLRRNGEITRLGRCRPQDPRLDRSRDPKHQAA